MKKSILITALLFFALIISAQTNQTYEYVTISQYSDQIYVANPGSEYEIIKLDDKKIRMTPSNYTPLLKMVEEYESKGWAFVSNVIRPTGTAHAHVVLMRRPKE